MTFDTAVVDRDMAAVIADMGTTMSWKGHDYACAIGEITDGARLEMAGLYPEVDVQILVRSGLFDTSLPAAGDVVIVSTVSYRIARTVKGPDGKGLLLLCQHHP